MNPQDLLLGGFAATVLLSLVIGAYGRRRSSPTLVSFFWGDNNFSVAQGTHLNLSTSFAINGVLYSAWLGYLAGWPSILPQLVWCAGFLFLGRYAKRLAHLARTGTLHGNIGYVFGAGAARWAALASVIGFTLLFGWELHIGASMFKAVEASHSPLVETVLYFSLAAIAAIYCMLGGLRGNLYANQFQNYLSGAALIVAIGYLAWFATGTKAFTLSDFYAPSNFAALYKELAFAGVVTNAVLFTVYQFVDMSVWQNIAAVSNEGKKPARTLWATAFWVLIFPGVSGSALGMLMRSFEGITSDTIVPHILQQVAAEPFVFTLLVMGFFAMMLSTVDGFLLSAAQAITWDVTDRKLVLQILSARGSPDFSPDDIRDEPLFISRLVGRSDPLSAHLWEQMSESTQRALMALNSGDGSPPPSTLKLLTDDLNKALRGNSLYSAERFAGVRLGKETEDYLKSGPQGDGLVLLNRWLLEDAYPSELTYNEFSNTLRKEHGHLDKKWKIPPHDLAQAETRVLDHAKYAIFALALIGGAITLYLVRVFGVSSFNLLYITYVAQMALFPTIWIVLQGERERQSRGAASIGFGLLAGATAAVYGLVMESSIAPWAPVIALGVACAFCWPFRKRSTVDVR